MKCIQCQIEIGDFPYCPHCGTKQERKCPKCNRMVELKFPHCPYCGSLMEKAITREDQLKDADTLILRYQYHEAKRIYDALINDDMRDMDAYIGLIRISSRNYTLISGSDLDRNISIAYNIFGKETLENKYSAFADFIQKRQNYYDEIERRKQEEIKRKEREEKERKEQAEKERKKWLEYYEKQRAFEADMKKQGFDLSGSTLRKYNGTSVDVIIPDCIKEIDDFAFADNQYVRSVTFHKNITKLGHSVFKGCSNLMRVTLPPSLQYSDADCETRQYYSSIPRSMFEGCSNLVEFEVPVRIYFIEEKAFNGCYRLTTITLPNVRSIGKEAFSGCRCLSNITLPDTVHRIMDNAFLDCSALPKPLYVSQSCNVGNIFGEKTEYCYDVNFKSSYKKAVPNPYGNYIKRRSK